MLITNPHALAYSRNLMHTYHCIYLSLKYTPNLIKMNSPQLTAVSCKGLCKFRHLIWRFVTPKSRFGTHYCLDQLPEAFHTLSKKSPTVLNEILHSKKRLVESSRLHLALEC